MEYLVTIELPMYTLYHVYCVNIIPTSICKLNVIKLHNCTKIYKFVRILFVVKSHNIL